MDIKTLLQGPWYTLLFSAFILTPAFAGMNFTGLSDRAMITPPEFHNSEEALRYGKSSKGNQDALLGLYMAHKRYQEELDALMPEYRRTKDAYILKQCLEISIKNQLVDESLDAAYEVGASVYSGSIPTRRVK